MFRILRLSSSIPVIPVIITTRNLITKCDKSFTTNNALKDQEYTKIKFLQKELDVIRERKQALFFHAFVGLIVFFPYSIYVMLEYLNLESKEEKIIKEIKDEIDKQE